MAPIIILMTHALVTRLLDDDDIDRVLTVTLAGRQLGLGGAVQS